MFNIIMASIAVSALMIFGIIDSFLEEGKARNRNILILGIIFALAVVLLVINLIWRII